MLDDMRVGSPEWVEIREVIRDAERAVARLARLARRHDDYQLSRKVEWLREDLRTAQGVAFGGCEVYVIRRVDTGEVKIGISTNPEARLRGLQTAHGARLELVAHFPGNAADEAQLHQQFAAHRKSGEWFDSGPEIREWMATLVAGATDG